MSKKNPFEVLRVSPSFCNQEIIEHARELIEEASPQEKKQIQKAVQQIITNPVERLEHELFTHHGADYEKTSRIQSQDVFLHDLLCFLKRGGLKYELEPGLLVHFYHIISNHQTTNEFRAALIQGDRNGAEKAWISIFRDNRNNNWFSHSLALLHQEWAEEYEQEEKLELASFHWKESRKHWFRICCLNHFWKSLRMEEHNLNLDQQFHTFASQFPRMLLQDHLDRLQRYLIQKKSEFALLHFNCIKAAREIPPGHSIDENVSKEISAEAVSLVENFTATQLQEARQRLGSGQPPNGLRQNYEAAISHLQTFLTLDPDNRRVLKFVLELYNDWCYDLYTVEDHSRGATLIDQARPYIERFAVQITKGQGHISENQVVARGFVFQGFFSNKADQRIASYQTALEYYPDSTEAMNHLYAGLWNLAAEAYNRKEFDVAINYLKKMPPHHEKYAEVQRYLLVVYNNKGVWLMEQGADHASIIQCFQEAIDIDPHNDMARKNMSMQYNAEGVRLYKQGRLPEAIGYYQKALQFDSSNQRARENLWLAQNTETLPTRNHRDEMSRWVFPVKSLFWYFDRVIFAMVIFYLYLKWAFGFSDFATIMLSIATEGVLLYSLLSWTSGLKRIGIFLFIGLITFLSFPGLNKIEIEKVRFLEIKYPRLTHVLANFKDEASKTLKIPESLQPSHIINTLRTFKDKAFQTSKVMENLSPAEAPKTITKNSKSEGKLEPKIYIIKPGDTLHRIAKDFNVPLETLAQVNKITNPSLIQVGQKLLIPSMEEIPQ